MKQPINHSNKYLEASHIEVLQKETNMGIGLPLGKGSQQQKGKRLIMHIK